MRPTFRDLHAGHLPATPRRRADAWLLDDPDLAPPPRRETPLSAWT